MSVRELPKDRIIRLILNFYQEKNSPGTKDCSGAKSPVWLADSIHGNILLKIRKVHFLFLATLLFSQKIAMKKAG
jgi:hypothetical protein